MLPDVPHVYVSISALSTFCKRISELSNTSGIEERQKWLFFEKLIFEQSKVFLSLDDEQIKEYVNYSPKEKELFVRENNFSPVLIPYLDRLLSNGLKITSCKRIVDALAENNFESYFEQDEQPIFIFLDKAKDCCDQISQQIGAFVISKDFHFDKENTEVKADFISANENVRYDQIFRNIPPFQWLLISDPYFFDKQNITGKVLISILESLNVKDREIDLTIYFIDNEKINPRTVEENLKKQFPKLKMTFVSGTKLTISHDRSIFTNTFWIVCEYGFKGRYPGTTKFIRFPLNTYYPIYKKTYEKIFRGGNHRLN